MEWFVGGWHFIAHFGQPSCPVPAFLLCLVPITTILSLCVLQVPVPIHGPAGCHVTQRGAAFWVSQPLLHICWLSVLGREMGRRKGFGAGGLVPISWHPACLLVLHAAGGGVPQGTHAGAHRSPIHTPLLFRFKYVIGIGVGAGAYVLAKFAVSLGLGWAGPASSVPAVSSGHGEEQELTPQAGCPTVKAPGEMVGLEWQCRGHGGWEVLPQVSHCSHVSPMQCLCSGQWCW